jgi:antitoxin VapB
MSLNIKSERVHALAREAAQQLGMSQTSVVEEALVQLLARHRLDTHETVETRVRAILDDFDRHLTDVDRAAMRRDMEELYDEGGLPA